MISPQTLKSINESQSVTHILILPSLDDFTYANLISYIENNGDPHVFKADNWERDHVSDIFLKWTCQDSGIFTTDSRFNHVLTHAHGNKIIENYNKLFGKEIICSVFSKETFTSRRIQSATLS